MAAIIHPHQPLIPATRSSRRRHLTVIDGGPEAALRHRCSAGVYRRRRITVAAGMLVLLLAVASVASGMLPAGAESTSFPAAGLSAAPPVAVVVQPGDTVWSIARRIQPTGDVRGLVDELSAANGGVALRVGQRLVLPGS